MLGDSLTWGMVQNLWSILAVRQRLPRYPMVASGTVACPHHRSVMFLMSNAAGRLPNDRIVELASSGTLTVINAGAHYSKAKGSSGLSDFTNDLLTAASASALAAMCGVPSSQNPSRPRGRFLRKGCRAAATASASVPPVEDASGCSNRGVSRDGFG